MITQSCNFDKSQYLQLRISINWAAGTPLGEESAGHFLSSAGNVITARLCAFDKLQ